jgi:Arc/MetJ-type ribon-helix-helix transcriptional regulator
LPSVERSQFEVESQRVVEPGKVSWVRTQRARNRIPIRYHFGMSTQIAVRLPDEIVAFVDREVGEKRAASRAAVVLAALERERRRCLAARDAVILAAEKPDETAGDDMDSLARYAADLPTDPD